MDFFSQTYIALRGPTGAPQSAADTISRLSDRLSPATLLADRRAAVLSLKGLARDWKADVGSLALPGLLDVLQNDSDVDADIGRAVLETLNLLCEVEESAAATAKELGFKHTDRVLQDSTAVHKLFVLLADTAFYLRFATLQLLSTLLQNRRQVVQGYFLKAPVGPASVVSVLEEKRDIVRNEAILMVQSLISQSPDIQKILAFEGAFEKFFNIVAQEGGLDGGVVVQDALTCVDTLLRYNTSNQSYFRETSLPPLLCSLLGYPPNLPPQEPAPQGFALQFWNVPKISNASLVVGIMGMLVSSKGGNPQETFTFSRCLVELGLASNAPTALKTQALRLLPTNLILPLPQMVLTPYMPVPDTNGEEWDRLEPASALDALVELVLHGEYNGMYSERRAREGLELRGAALNVFQNFVQNDEIKEAIVRAMVPPEGSPHNETPVTPLLQALVIPPSSPLAISAVTSTHLASLLFAHLLRFSSRAKTIARSIIPHSVPPPDADHGNFFVPADGTPPTEPSSATSAPEPEDEDEDPPQTLLQILSEHLSLAFLSRARADTSDRETREWDRLIVGYLCLLAQWLWEDPPSVREFLEAGALGMLVEPINQIADMDAVVPGLCAFVLAVCYEFNREPGEVTRASIYPILSRLGVDMLVGRITRLRDDDRFKAVGPDTLVLPYPHQVTHVQLPGTKIEGDSEAEIWFDWAFVDFWKSNYYAVQKGLSTDPNKMTSASAQSAESAMLVASLRDVIKTQAQEIETLQRKLKELSSADDERQELQIRLEQLSVELQSSEEKQRDVEKEQEDLLVLLDELNIKRRRDKDRMREAGLEVSEDEGDDDSED